MVALDLNLTELGSWTWYFQHFLDETYKNLQFVLSTSNCCLPEKENDTGEVTGNGEGSQNVAKELRLQLMILRSI